MRYQFYDSETYRKQQAEITKKSWQTGIHDAHRAKTEFRRCLRNGCDNRFEVKYYYIKRFCSRSCAAIHNNYLRGPQKSETRNKISIALRGRIYPSRKGINGIRVPRLIKSCKLCKKTFETTRWQNHCYCSVKCSMRDIGSRRTSPKAARGKSGIRSDIDSTLYFYSRWEANFARILNLLNIKWKFQPKAFDLGFQKYTPDFYLPETDEYIEIKNFLSNYSKRRDDEFRKLYPREKLILVLKSDYIKLQATFSSLIKNWEFS